MLLTEEQSYVRRKGSLPSLGGPASIHWLESRRQQNQIAARWLLYREARYAEVLVKFTI